MILKTQPDSRIVCGSSRDQSGDSFDATVGQDTTVQVQKLTSSGVRREIGEVDKQEDQNHCGGDISLNSNDAATEKGEQRPMAIDKEKTSSSSSTTTVRQAINNTAEDSATTDTLFHPYDCISNCQEHHDAKRRKGTNSDNDNKSIGDGHDDGVMRKRIERLWTPDRGRIMVARSRIPRGTFLYRLEAQATVCDTENRTRRCASCFKRMNPYADDDPVKEVVEEARQANGGSVGGGSCVCEGCEEIWYCNQVCADRDWALLHAAECQFLKSLYQGIPAAVTSNKNDNTNNDNDNVEEGMSEWMKVFSVPHRNAIARFSQDDFTPYTQDFCRVLIRTLTHRFHELTDPTFIPQGLAPTDPPYLGSTDPDQPQGPLPYSCVEDLVANQATYSKEQVEGEFCDVLRILDAFQTHLEAYYLPRLQQLRLPHHRRQQKGARAGDGTGFGDLPKRPPPRRLLETELMDLIMREECNSFGMYEYPPLPLPPTVANNSKSGYALGFFTRQYVYGFNHSCSPNMFHVAHNKHLLYYAGRDILPGEEINITYLELGPHYRIPFAATVAGGADGVGTGVGQEEAVKMRRKSREAFEKRRAFLKAHFHFDCGCARCTYEAALYSSLDDNDDKVKRMKEEKRLSEEEDRVRFLREGLSCEREGCFGFYAPPSVLRARQDHDEDDRSGKDDDEGRPGMDVDGHWGCVACGHRQS
ncbi:hypothetical protein BGZ96_010899 [Linnemannia gamsii]|uniref:SET domain-containing protein n=1 Tax=Linnemannia gamsii TaxID=64522 RepID=A0ABQ7JTQ8_9FUNG|nr:hypothetical protein BGZ96_010899 [Linnemannia gamsii]